MPRGGEGATATHVVEIGSEAKADISNSKERQTEATDRRLSTEGTLGAAILRTSIV